MGHGFNINMKPSRHVVSAPTLRQPRGNATTSTLPSAPIRVREEPTATRATTQPKNVFNPSVQRDAEQANANVRRANAPIPEPIWHVPGLDDPPRNNIMPSMARSAETPQAAGARATAANTRFEDWKTARSDQDRNDKRAIEERQFAKDVHELATQRAKQNEAIRERTVYNQRKAEEAAAQKRAHALGAAKDWREAAKARLNDEAHRMAHATKTLQKHRERAAVARRTAAEAAAAEAAAAEASRRAAADAAEADRRAAAAAAGGAAAPNSPHAARGAAAAAAPATPAPAPRQQGTTHHIDPAHVELYTSVIIGLNKGERPVLHDLSPEKAHEIVNNFVTKFPSEPPANLERLIREGYTVDSRGGWHQKGKVGSVSPPAWFRSIDVGSPSRSSSTATTEVVPTQLSPVNGNNPPPLPHTFPHSGGRGGGRGSGGGDSPGVSSGGGRGGGRS